MTVRICQGSIVVRSEIIALAGGIDAACATAGAAAYSTDGVLLSMRFVSETERRRWIGRLRELAGSEKATFAVFDAACEPFGDVGWLQFAVEDAEGGEAWLPGSARSEATEWTDCRRDFSRHEVLSRSSSGMHFVRDRATGVLRQFTEGEMADLQDPAPCRDCGEQFGCEHANCAGEPLLEDGEIRALVPQQWLAFAREHGVSRNDIDRLSRIESVEGEYRIRDGAEHDMRSLELVLLLNEFR